MKSFSRFLNESLTSDLLLDRKFKFGLEVVSEWFRGDYQQRQLDSSKVSEIVDAFKYTSDLIDKTFNVNFQPANKLYRGFNLEGIAHLLNLSPRESPRFSHGEESGKLFLT